MICQFCHQAFDPSPAAIGNSCCGASKCRARHFASALARKLSRPVPKPTNMTVIVGGSPRQVRDIIERQNLEPKRCITVYNEYDVERIVGLDVNQLHDVIRLYHNPSVYRHPTLSLFLQRWDLRDQV